MPRSRMGRVPDPRGGVHARGRRGIAYRAVRNRGTIGGSLVPCRSRGGLGRQR